jgi:hypothetical protein
VVYHYRVYGLSCFSDVPIAGFISQPVTTQRSDPDVVLDLVSVGPEWVSAFRRLPKHTVYVKPRSAENTDSGFTIKVIGEESAFELTYTDGTQFLVDGSASRVWGRCPPGFDMDYLSTYLRGPVMGFILRRRGITALHASALSFCGRAIVLCGQSQSGKSTIAAALALRGTPVLCEDVTALKASAHSYHVQPGYAQVGLWPDAVENLLGAADALPRLTSSWEKCFLPLDGDKAKFDPEERPLGVIYLLAPRTELEDAPKIEQVGPRQALLDLVQNTYMNWLLDQKQRAAEFDFLGTLVTHIPVRRIVPHSDPARIPALCDLVTADARALWNRQGSASLISSS